MDKNNLLGLINAQTMTEQMVKDAREEQLNQVIEKIAPLEKMWLDFVTDAFPEEIREICYKIKKVNSIKRVKPYDDFWIEREDSWVKVDFLIDGVGVVFTQKDTPGITFFYNGAAQSIRTHTKNSYERTHRNKDEFEYTTYVIKANGYLNPPVIYDDTKIANVSGKIKEYNANMELFRKVNEILPKLYEEIGKKNQEMVDKAISVMNRDEIALRNDNITDVKEYQIVITVKEI